jgi:hypothetical protein
MSRPAALGQNERAARKVKGLVVRLDRGVRIFLGALKGLQSDLSFFIGAGVGSASIPMTSP